MTHGAYIEIGFEVLVGVEDDAEVETIKQSTMTYENENSIIT